MTRLSVNINKVALIRNSRGENLPNLVQFAKDCESFGAEGITVHPRPDQRHIRYDDIPKLKAIVSTEFNIEGFPSDNFIQLVLDNKPHQVTLVPDPPGVLTSNTGWDVRNHHQFLVDVISTFKSNGIRTSLFLNADIQDVEAAAAVETDRIEFYTGHYAKEFEENPENAVLSHVDAARVAGKLGLGVNAGHDLNLKNLRYYRKHVMPLNEVSIGHAIISDALYFGIQNTIEMYLRLLNV